MYNCTMYKNRRKYTETDFCNQAKIRADFKKKVIEKITWKVIEITMNQIYSVVAIFLIRNYFTYKT